MTTQSKQESQAQKELAAVEEVLEQAMVFDMDPNESISDHVEHLIEYIHRLEDKLEDSAVAVSMIRALGPGLRGMKFPQ